MKGGPMDGDCAPYSPFRYASRPVRVPRGAVPRKYGGTARRRIHRPTAPAALALLAIEAALLLLSWALRMAGKAIEP